MSDNKNKSADRPALSPEAVSDYAYHLYEQTGCAPGHDLDNWLEAEACLQANVSKNEVHTRIHRQRGNRQEVQSLAEYRI